MNIKTTAWSQTLLVGVFALIVLMPFHAFFTTWIGTTFDIRPLLQAWKEVLLLFLLLGSFIVSWRCYELRQDLLRSKLFWVIVIYAALHFLLAVIMRNPEFQELLALKYNLSFLAAFLVAIIAGHFIADRSRLEEKLITLILSTSVVVAGVAIAQGLYLPADWLSNFGYGPETIAPYQPIQDSNTTRSISTLGGPNQLGSFLLLPFALSLYLCIKRRNWYIHAPLLAVFTLALFFSHSRSAWIGALIATIIVVGLSVSHQRARKAGLVVVAILAMVGGVIYLNIERSPYLQTAILHSSYEKAFTASSNTDHFIAMTKGAELAFNNPQGIGPGGAGPATQGTTEYHIAENYYLQISVEVGLLGLALFLTLMYLVSRRLYELHGSHLAIPLLASFWGIAFFNFLLHGWTDSTTSLVWWGVAGLTISPNVTKLTKKVPDAFVGNK